MHLLACTLLLGSVSVSSGALATDLHLEGGSLASWEKKGDAFYLTKAGSRGPSPVSGVCSSDRGPEGRTGWLRKVFTVPAGVRHIHFTAFAVRKPSARPEPPDATLDVLLMARGKKVIPKEVYTSRGWQPADRVLPRCAGRAQEYRWDVSALTGLTVQIVIADCDARPGHYLFCSGFRVVAAPEDQTQAFARDMTRLVEDHHLAPTARYDSRHFMAMSNTDEHFTRLRLRNCELIYRVFFQHFRRKGFPLQEPSSHLMVAIFDTQAGFEAYLGHKMPAVITGMYHPLTNRFVVYDYAQNAQFLAAKRRALEQGQAASWRFDRKRYVDTVYRWERENRTDANLGTTMHEVAHQLSFNVGLLNRRGDVPAWLAEGLACYCESTDNGAWQGIGELNPDRLRTFAAPLSRRGPFFPVRDLLTSDQWRNLQSDPARILTGYAQSWALFRMLMEEQPRTLRKYLALIHDRRTPDHRLADFCQVFGANLRRLDTRHQEYIQQLVEDFKGPR
jgi:hypothetical protein